jgi:DnaJ-class molecular chaperone
MFEDYYEILEITCKASKSEIKTAFRTQALKWHPDKNIGQDTTARMQLINEAYLILNDTEARAMYDIEYKRFKSFVNFKNININEDSHFQEEYMVQDEILFKWMQNAKKQAANIVMQTLKDFKDIGLEGVKAATKASGNQLIAQLVISVLAIIIFFIVGKCN